MVHPLGKRPLSWFGPDDINNVDAISACLRMQMEWDVIYYKMSWWTRLCCFLAGDVTEPPGHVPFWLLHEPPVGTATRAPSTNMQSKESPMKNEELLHRRGSRLNSFTRALREACRLHGTVMVRLRNGDTCLVKYLPAHANNDEFEHPYEDAHEGGFLSDGSYSYWQANGESITGERFDIVEFDPIVRPAHAVILA